MWAEVRYIKVVSVVSAVVSGLVLSGWLAGMPQLAQLFSGLAAMQFNSALSSLLLSAALWLMVGSRPRLASAPAAASLALGLATLLEYGIAGDFHIDDWGGLPFSAADALRPGRMAVSSAVCYTLAAGGMIGEVAGGRDRHPALWLGLPVLAIAALAILGYLLGLETGYTWFRTSMPPSTAACLLLISGGLITWDRRGKPVQRLQIFLGVTIFAYLCGLIFTYAQVSAVDWAELRSHTAIGGLPRLVLLSGLMVVGLVAYLAMLAVSVARSAQALRDSESRHRAIIETTADGLITIDGRGTMLSINPAGERIFGYLAEDCIGRNVSMLMPQPYRDGHDGYLASYRRTGDRKVIGIGREVQGQRRDGSVFPLDLAVGEVRLGGETIYSGIVRDVSQRVRQTRELEVANRELEEFAYRTSHDLRSPIASSRGLLTVALDALEGANPELARDAVARVHANMLRLESLIEDIHSLTRIRKFREEAVQIDVEAAVREVLLSLDNMPNFDRVRISTDLPAPQLIRTRPTRLTIILSNLISNGIKYADFDKADPFLSIRGRLRERRYLLEVEDNGIGIPADKRERVFGMFERFHPRKSVGSGLGLYILHNTVEMLGGTVRYEPMAAGTRFQVELPAGSED